MSNLVWANPSNGNYTLSTDAIPGITPPTTYATAVFAIGQQQSLVDAPTLSWWSGTIPPNLAGGIDDVERYFHAPNVGGR